MNLINVPALQDNYIWILYDNSRHCVIIDPGTAEKTLEQIHHLSLIPQAILLTHHHNDHTAGVAELVAAYPNLKVYGPEETRSKGADYILTAANRSLTIGDITFSIIQVPGHTAGHLAYYCAPYLFCGDTLFSAGCGRLFEGTAQQMYQSLQKITALPDETLICCAHEYTLSNIKFAQSILPDDQEIIAYRQQLEERLAASKPTIPSQLITEKRINIFLRCDEKQLQNRLGFSGQSTELWCIFSELRRRKDKF